jgi:predicted RNA-binding Zn-ribbon protein involved in translation (DUF1610 family)
MRPRQNVFTVSADHSRQICPFCDKVLVYCQTMTAGVAPVERWDYFECRTCGPFVYRHRTRKLRREYEASA